MLGRAFVLKQLQERIAVGSVPVGSRLPSERTLAEELGVGRGVVKAAFFDLEALGYLRRQPNCRPIVISNRAKNDPNGPLKSRMIAVWILQDFQDLGGNMILQGIREELGGTNYQLLIGCARSCEAEAIQKAEIEFWQSVSSNSNVVGAIVWDSGHIGGENAIERLEDTDFPVIFIDREPANLASADVVATNNRRAARTAVRYLIQLGHHRVGMVLAGERASSVVERIEGYQSALSEAGIVPEEEWLFELSAKPGVSFGDAAKSLLTQLRSRDERPTALFAVNDFVALTLLEAARDLNIDIPRSLSIVGFDWLMRWLPSGGELTTVSQPFDDIGRTAVRLLLDRLGRTTPKTSRHILLEAPLVIKRTTGAPFDLPTPSHSNPIGDKYETQPTSVHAY
jgi:DNA-binding LacI/PurR family transcriptional regulator